MFFNFLFVVVAGARSDLSFVIFARKAHIPIANSFVIFDRTEHMHMNMQLHISFLRPLNVLYAVCYLIPCLHPIVNYSIPIFN